MKDSHHALRNKKGRSVIEPGVFEVKSGIQLPTRLSSLHKPNVSIRSRVMKSLRTKNG